jgi:CubicO group peptidase (beta-lactamase class C family)
MLGVIKAVTPFTPEQAGYSPERLEHLDSHYRKLIEDGKVQGVIYAITRDGKVFANRAMGKASFRPEDERLCKPDSIRMIASVTKIFTTSAILKLAEDGLLLVTDPVSKFIEEFNNPTHGKINLRHLLTHTSGLAPDESMLVVYRVLLVFYVCFLMKPVHCKINILRGKLVYNQYKNETEENPYCSLHIHSTPV